MVNLPQSDNARFLILPPPPTGVKMVGMTELRPYRGVQALDRIAQRRRRLLEAGLQLLGGTETPAELTVRDICRQAGVSARYFYESFTDKDQLVGDVFDWVIADVATTTQAAVAEAPHGEQNRAGMENIVQAIARDARIGRLLFSTQLSNPVINAKRVESGALLAALYGRHFETALGLDDSEIVSAVAHFVVGGVAHVISAWLSTGVDLPPAGIVDGLTTMLDALANPRLYE